MLGIHRADTELDLIVWFNESGLDLRKKFNSYEVEQILDKLLEHKRYVLYKRERCSKVKWYYRLTIVFLPIVWVLLLLFAPFNYILTGSFAYPDNKFFIYIQRWLDKLLLY